MQQKTIAVFVMLITAVLLTPISSMAAGDAKQAAVASVVHHFGYGGGIHNFKNFVLRGKDKHMNNAAKHLNEVKGALAALGKQKLSAAEAKSVADIGGVVDQYLAALPAVKKMVAAGKSAKERDGAVKISDGPAKDGIKALRSGGSNVQNIEYALGYGGAIHNFKNCVLRGNGKGKCDKAKAGFDAAMAILGGMKGAAADGIKSTVTAYLGAIPEVIKLSAAGKTAEEIDGVVKISDGPAKEGLAALNK